MKMCFKFGVIGQGVMNDNGLHLTEKDGVGVARSW
jgi:hypothetical protein